MQSYNNNYKYTLLVIFDFLIVNIIDSFELSIYIYINTKH